MREAIVVLRRTARRTTSSQLTTNIVYLIFSSSISISISSFHSHCSIPALYNQSPLPFPNCFRQFLLLCLVLSRLVISLLIYTIQHPVHPFPTPSPPPHLHYHTLHTIHTVVVYIFVHDRRSSIVLLEPKGARTAFKFPFTREKRASTLH